MADPQVGYLCVLSLVAGTVPIARGKDVKLNASRGEADVSSRNGAGWKESLPGLAEWGVDASVVWVADEAGFLALQTAFTGGGIITADFVDAAGAGYYGNCTLTKWEVTQPLNGGVEVAMALKGCGLLNVLPRP